MESYIADGETLLTDHFDFDKIINREGTHSLKNDASQSLFGRAD